VKQVIYLHENLYSNKVNAKTG